MHSHELETKPQSSRATNSLHRADTTFLHSRVVRSVSKIHCSSSKARNAVWERVLFFGLLSHHSLLGFLDDIKYFGFAVIVSVGSDAEKHLAWIFVVKKTMNQAEYWIRLLGWDVLPEARSRVMDLQVTSGEVLHLAVASFLVEVLILSLHCKLTNLIIVIGLVSLIKLSKMTKMN